MRFSSSFLTVQKIVISLHKRMKKIIFFIYILSVNKKMFLSHLLSWFWFSGSCKLAMVLDAKKNWGQKICYHLYSILAILYIIAVWGTETDQVQKWPKKCFPNRSCLPRRTKDNSTSLIADTAEALVWAKLSGRLSLIYLCGDVSHSIYRASIKLRLM